MCHSSGLFMKRLEPCLKLLGVHVGILFIASQSQEICLFTLSSQTCLRGHFLAETLHAFFSILPSEGRTTFVYSVSRTGDPRLNFPEAILSLISVLSFWLFLGTGTDTLPSTCFFRALLTLLFPKR